MKGRRVITVDARNHGESPHTTNMTYLSMAADLSRLIQVSHIMSLSLSSLTPHHPHDLPEHGCSLQTSAG